MSWKATTERPQWNVMYVPRTSQTGCDIQYLYHRCFSYASCLLVWQPWSSRSGDPGEVHRVPLPSWLMRTRAAPRQPIREAVASKPASTANQRSCGIKASQYVFHTVNLHAWTPVCNNCFVKHLLHMFLWTRFMTPVLEPESHLTVAYKSSHFHFHFMQCALYKIGRASCRERV